MAFDPARQVPSSSCKVGILPCGFFREERRHARRARQDVELHPAVGPIEERKEEPDLVAVAAVERVASTAIRILIPSAQSIRRVCRGAKS